MSGYVRRASAAGFSWAFIAGGRSGHGYKFCSVIGRVMSNFHLAEEGK